MCTPISLTIDVVSKGRDNYRKNYHFRYKDLTVVQESSYQHYDKLWNSLP